MGFEFIWKLGEEQEMKFKYRLISSDCFRVLVSYIKLHYHWH